MPSTTRSASAATRLCALRRAIAARSGARSANATNGSVHATTVSPASGASTLAPRREQREHQRGEHGEIGQAPPRERADRRGPVDADPAAGEERHRGLAQACGEQRGQRVVDEEHGGDGADADAGRHVVQQPPQAHDAARVRHADAGDEAEPRGGRHLARHRGDHRPSDETLHAQHDRDRERRGDGERDERARREEADVRGHAVASRKGDAGGYGAY